MRFMALFATGYLMAYAVDKWRKSGLYGNRMGQDVYQLETSTFTLPDASRSTRRYIKQRILEQNAGLGGTLIHLG